MIITNNTYEWNRAAYADADVLLRFHESHHRFHHEFIVFDEKIKNDKI
jgi:hypothetical protein